jgi:tripeptidyl-peptidase-1
MHFRYHVPAHIQEHVDYITPGIKLFAPNRKGGETDLDKRTFGITSGKGKDGYSPPLMKPLGLSIEALLALAELSVCDQYITPPCVAGIIFFRFVEVCN